MRLLSVEMRNFGCFRDQKILLPQDPGLFLFTGDNGVGKSTIFNAITWCLYEQDARGRKAGKLMHRGAQGGYSVELVFDEFRVQRTWSPNSLKLDGQVVSNKVVAQRIGLDLDSFLLTIYMAQGAEHFFDMKPSEKLSFLSRIFDLDRWSQCADLAKQKAQGIQKEYELNRRTQEQVQIRLDQAKDSIEDLSLKVQEWDSGELRRVEELTKQLEDFRTRSASWDSSVALEKQDLRGQLDAYQQRELKFEEERQSALLGLRAEIKDLSSKLVDEQEWLRGLDELNEAALMIKDALKQVPIGELQKQLSGLDRQVWDHQRAIESSKERINSIREKTGQSCPTCDQVIGRDHTAKVVGQVEEQVQKRLKQLALAESELRAKQKELDDGNLFHQQMQAELDGIAQQTHELNLRGEGNKALGVAVQLCQKSLDAKQNEQNPYTETVARIQAKIKEDKPNPYICQVERLEGEIKERPQNPYLEQLARQQSSLELHTGEIDRLTSLLQTLITRQVGYEFWQKQFPLLRLSVLEEVIRELQLHFNMALGKVGLSDCSVEITTEKELKSSDQIRKELTLKVIRSGKEIDPDTLSGGERQAFRISSAIGIADMIRSRTGSTWILQLLDEPLTWLSVNGVQEALAYLAELAEERTILMAEHGVRDQARFTGTLQLIKDNRGVSSATWSIQSLNLLETSIA